MGDPAPTTKTPTVPVLLNIGANKTWHKRFVAAGVHVKRESRQQLESVEAQRNETFGKDHRQRLGGRTDSAGNTVGDDGTPLFGASEEGAPYDGMSLDKVIGDLRRQGYVLTRIWLKLKENQHAGMGALMMSFNPEGEALELSDELQDVIDRCLARPFKHVHVWDNRKTAGTATVNPRHAVPEQEIAALTDPRTLRIRIDKEGIPRFSCVKVPTPKATQAKPEGPQPDGPAAA